MGAIRWNIENYNNVRTALLALSAAGEGVDFDSAAAESYGYQCWDVAANFWWNAGREIFKTKNSFTGAGGVDSYVSTAVTYQPAKTWNEGSPFYFVGNWIEVKRGMMCVWQAGGCNGLIGTTGHNAFADQDVTNINQTITCLGQNQTGYQVPEGGYPPTLNSYFNADGFLGAFAYSPWFGSTPPEPPTPNPPSGITLHPNGSPIAVLRKACQRKRLCI